MAPFLEIFILWDIQVYICSLYNNNEIAYVEVFVNEKFSLTSTLNVPYVHSYICVLDYSLNDTRVDWYICQAQFILGVKVCRISLKIYKLVK